MAYVVLHLYTGIWGLEGCGLGSTDFLGSFFLKEFTRCLAHGVRLGYVGVQGIGVSVGCCWLVQDVACTKYPDIYL